MKKTEPFFSWEALLRIVVIGVIVYLAWQALGILADVLVSIVLAASFYPIVKKIEIYTKLPFIVSTFLVLAIPIIIFFVLLGFSVFPTLNAQLPDLLASLNTSIGHLSILNYSLSNFNVIEFIKNHLDYTAATASVTLTLFSIFTTVFLTFYLIYDAEKLSNLFIDIFPSKEKSKLKAMMHEVAKVTGKYIRGNVLISIICGFIIFVGLTILQVPYALPLSIFIAILDLLPIVGPTIGIIPSVLIAFGISPVKALLVIVLFLIYAQIENAILSPLIYNKALHLYPSMIFLSVIVGGSLFGVLGAFLALPVAASIPPIIEYQKNYKKRNSAD